MQKDENKTLISLLATGSEIICSDIQDTNSHNFAQKIHANGGVIYQRMQVSDKKPEIIAALQYLLHHSDAVILTGGLGPTSDDTTRFAIAETIASELQFNELAWDAIVARMQRFHLVPTQSNRQQALFPKGAELFPNDYGTAYGCHLVWQGKHIFMLPGPPKECVPMFDQHVFPLLQQLNFFQQYKTHKWLTLGLVEGEIAAQVDELAKSYPVETGYRWSYPYLEIKIISQHTIDVEELVQALENRLQPHVVSRDGSNASALLQAALQSSPVLQVLDEVTQDELAEEWQQEKIQFVKTLKKSGKCLHLSLLEPLTNPGQFAGSVTFICKGYLNDQLVYEHQLKTSNRGPEVMAYAKAYFAWQACKFISY